MSCNKPLIAKPDGFTSSGKVKYMPIGRYDTELAIDYPDAIMIPCGKCAGCRAQKTREWADRMILELDHSKKAVFLTLTYNDDHLPVKMQISTGQCEMTLQPRDLTLFFKRLRKKYKDAEIRYYACGEYGKNTFRPHYHVILFGLGLSDFKDIKVKGKNELGDIYYVSEELADNIWKNGYCMLSEVSWNTCAYVARYVKKKDYGLVSDEFVDRVRYPEYSVMSRDPGIGMYYPKEHEDFADRSKYYFGDQKGLVEVFFPKSFMRWLETNDPAKYEELKVQRKCAMRDSELNRIIQTDLTSMEMDDISENHISSTESVIDFYRGL